MPAHGDFRYLFGPVRSRRMGRSLGIDLVPAKTCTYDCPYCQCGATRVRTLERRPYVPAAAVLAELDTWMAAGGAADFITLSGAGEPTLHSEFGEILAGIAARTPIRRALLSNGSLFGLPEVRRAAGRAHVVKATLSAWDAASYEAAHHPHPGVRYDEFLAGLRAFRAEFAGEFWLEVFLMAGVNAEPGQVARIAALANDLRPDRVQLNTAVRPPADPRAQAVPLAALHSLAGLFSPVAEVPSAPAAAPAPAGDAGGDRARAVFDLVSRHPATAADVAASLGMDVAVARSILAELERSGRLRSEPRGAQLFYGPVAP